MTAEYEKMKGYIESGYKLKFDILKSYLKIKNDKKLYFLLLRYLHEKINYLTFSDPTIHSVILLLKDSCHQLEWGSYNELLHDLEELRTALNKKKRCPHADIPFLKKTILLLDQIIEEWKLYDVNARNLIDIPTFAIDSAKTKRYDDAFLLVEHETETEVIICIANVADHFEPIQAYDQINWGSSNKFFKSKKDHSKVSSTNLEKNYSLKEKRKRDVIAYSFFFDQDGNHLENKDCCYRARIRVTQNLTQEIAEAILEEETHPFHRTLSQLELYSRALTPQNSHIEEYHQLKSLIRNYYKENQFPSETNGDHVIDKMISRYMIYINYYSAKLAYDHHLPFLYRNNDCHLEVVENIPLDHFLDYVKSSKEEMKWKSTFELTNRGHDGLGLDYYSRVSSPMLEEVSLYNQKVLTDLWIDQKHCLEKVYRVLGKLLEESYLLSEKKDGKDQIEKKKELLFHKEKDKNN